MGIFSYFSKQDKKQDLIDELPQEQRDFFVTEEVKFDIENKQAQQLELNVKKAQTSAADSEFNSSTPRPNRRQALLENCSEVQMLLMQCLSNGTYKEKMTMCSARTSALFNCIDSQKKALTKLGLESARSKAEAEKIKGMSDDLFVKHFNKDGLNLTESAKSNFEQDLEQTRIGLWK